MGRLQCSTTNSSLHGRYILSMAMPWIKQGGIFFLFLLVRTVSGMDLGPGSISLQISRLGSQLSTLGSQLIQLQDQVEVLQQENMEDKQRIVHLEQVTEEFERRMSLLESVCSSSEMKTEISGPLMAIGGYGRYDRLGSAEVVNTSCDFPLPETRAGHTSVTTADGKTLVCGGYTDSPSGSTKSCLQFDYESKSWREHSSHLSSHRVRALAVTLSRGTYVLGGQLSAGTSSEFLATGSSVWTQGPDIPGDGVYKSCVAKLSDTEFVILGGIQDETQARVYDETRDEWRSWPRMNHGKYGHSCVGLGHIILMAGGDDTTETIIFDTITGSAREVASLKYSRRDAAMVLYGGKPLILG